MTLLLCVADIVTAMVCVVCCYECTEGFDEKKKYATFGLLASKPKTYNLQPQTSNLQPQTSNLKPQTQNLKPQTYNPKPKTYNPKPQT